MHQKRTGGGCTAISPDDAAIRNMRLALEVQPFRRAFQPLIHAFRGRCRRVSRGSTLGRGSWPRGSRSVRHRSPQSEIGV